MGGVLKDMTFHIKSLLLINIMLTSAILLSKSLFSSLLVFLTGLLVLVLFYGLSKLKRFFIALNKFKVIFITLVIFQLLLRRQGEVYFEYYFLKITEAGVFYAFSSLLRYLVIILSAVMLASASPYEMIKALRTWRLPEPVIIIVSFTIQFLRQLQVDFKILNQNLKKRNISFKNIAFPFDIGTYNNPPLNPLLRRGYYMVANVKGKCYRSWKARFELGGRLISPVIGRLFSDIKYKVIAMELNGYGLNKRVTPFKYKRCAVRDYALMLGCGGIFYFVVGVIK
jgi:energy-coupling factor transporter transmembrane protein EcfT